MIGKDRYRNIAFYICIYVMWYSNSTVQPVVRDLGAINAVATVIIPHDSGLFVFGLTELCC